MNRAKEIVLPERPFAALPEGISEDSFLGGTVTLRQPVRGYRAAIDPVMLAASVNAGPGERVLEAGTGHGAPAICLARRVPECIVTGLEIQPDLVRLANDNARLNGLAKNVQVMIGDLGRQMPRIAAGAFDHVMANPPFLDAAHAHKSPDGGRAAANVEGEAKLRDWVEFLLRMVRPKGTVTLIHRADRLDEILTLLYGNAGETVVFPLWPKRDVDAKRVIICARKGIRAPLTMSPGLILHEDDGSYTKQADAILRGGACYLR
ncbi:MAG: methyltransferase domain-containing protein [Pseudomonadota bacterium]|nr:methyltransferase domain-containing protein [Pseudomonadota bacterium]